MRRAGCIIERLERSARLLLSASVHSARRLAAEALGSALLAAVVVGSGIAAQHLSPGNVGLELLENAAATAAGLYAIILMFGPVSGAHLNPAITLADAALGGIGPAMAAGYIAAQVAGCSAGAVVANVMFSRAAVTLSTHHRASGGHLVAEVVATFGLVFLVFSLARTDRARTTPAAVGAYIGAAYFFTSSTSFANPAIVLGRMLSNSFAGIAPVSVPGFVAAELAGAGLALAVVLFLYPALSPADAAQVLVPHSTDADAESAGEDREAAS